MSVADAVVRSLIFVALAALTAVLAYFYQRNERTQSLTSVWTWPAFFSLLAGHAIVQQLPGDPTVGAWLAIAFPIGLAIGAARGIAFKVAAANVPHTLRIAATPASAAIYLAVLFYNEFLHVFRYGDPQMRRISCALLVLTAGSSIAVNAVRVVRYASINRGI
ncbi:MAG: hypothetical protein JO199_12435 [Candidatus Eremiobacteraeota bacterium]|nr:hypothetical protein [Candidatus Eremiobacteraeota bacterium]